MPRRGRSRGWGAQQDSGETVSEPSSSQPTSGETGVEASGSAVVEEGGSTPSPGPSTTGTGDKKKSTKTEDQKTKVVKQWKKMKIKTNNSSSGSPWDRVTRKQIDVKSLDLGKSYVGLLKQSSEGKKKKLPPRQTRWQHTGRTPLTDVESLPADWNANEPDLDPK